MATATDRMDELVRDYLLFRGFAGTLKSLESDLKSDRDKCFRANKIVEQLYQFISAYDLEALRQYWKHLNRRILTRLEYVHNTIIRKLEVSLMRLYVVHAIQNGKHDKVNEFFEKLAPELQGQSEWKEWFVLPFLRNAEQNPLFEMYFTKMWQDTLIISLQNFFSILFQSMPLPILLSFDEEYLRMNKLEKENKLLKQQMSVLQKIDLEKSSTEPKMVFGQIREMNEDFADIPKEAPNKEKQSQSKLINKLKAPLTAPLQRKKFTTNTSNSGNTGGATTLSSQKTTIRDISVIQDTPVTQGNTADTGIKPNLSPQIAAKLPKQKHFRQHDQQRKELFSKPPSQFRNTTNIATTSIGDEMQKDNQPAECSIMPNHTQAVETKVQMTTDESVDTSQPFIVLSQEEYIEHHSSITQARFSSVGTTIASTDSDGVVKVWSYSPSPVTTVTIMSKSPLISLEWVTKVERLLLLGSSNCIVKLFDTEAKRTLHEVPTDKLYPRITSLCCSPLGSSFVCSATKPNILSAEQTTLSEYHSASNIKAGKLWYWDMKTMKILREVPIELHTACINSTQFNHNGHLLVTGGSDGAVRLYDMHRYDCIMSWKAHNGPVYSVQFSPDENSVYSMGADGKFINWSIHDTGRRLLRDLSVHDGATGPFIVSGYSGYRQVHTPKGKLFAFDVEGCHVLTCASNGGVIYKLSDIGLSRTLTLLGHRAPVVSVDWSSAMNCGMCLTGSMDGRIRVTTILSQ